MVTLLIIIHVIVSIFLIISILLQSSKGGGLAGMFGGGGAMTGMFGGRGAATFLSKVTMWLGIAFALTSLTIGLLSSGTSGEQRSLLEQVSEGEQQRSTPATMLPTIPAEQQNTGETGQQGGGGTAEEGELPPAGEQQ